MYLGALKRSYRVPFPFFYVEEFLLIIKFILNFVLGLVVFPGIHINQYEESVFESIILKI